MFCPMCGSELILVIRKEFIEIDDLRIDESIWHVDESEWYKCNNCKCFGDDYPLILHHPLRGMESKPGDSWSLTWLK